MQFNGQTIAILASGPSLCAEDVEAVRSLPCVAVNSSWTLAPFCKVLFAGDHRWWTQNIDGITIPAKRVGLSSNTAHQYQAEKFKSKLVRNGYNSGCIAIEYAIAKGAGRILLLGYDCSIKNGIHHHGKHPGGNPNQQKCEVWKRQFQALRDLHPDADIVNCSRYTELDMFTRMALSEALD